MGAVWMELTHITCVLEMLILSPTCLAELFSLSVLVCMLYWLVGRGAKSSVKSRSSSWENRIHWIPLGLFAMVLVVIHMATRNRIAPLSHSGLHGKPLREVISHYDTTLKMFRMFLWLRWSLMVFRVQYLPEGVSVDTVKCLPEVHKVDVEGCIPFQALLYNVMQSKYLVHTSSSLPEACLLLPDAHFR